MTRSNKLATQRKTGAERKLVKLRKQYYIYLDRKAKYTAEQLADNKHVTKLILDYIKEMYEAAKSERDLEVDASYFEAAYHSPISSDLEFFIAKVLYHYSLKKELGWKIYLRRQFKSTAPDVRIEFGGRTLAIIEVKAKAGWIQSVFSGDRYKSEKKKYNQGKGQDPEISVKRFRDQCLKYCKTFELNKDQVFILLPSLVLVPRKKFPHDVQDYEKTFLKNSRLSEESLILLSTNLFLDLSSNPARAEYEPTDKFEQFVRTLTKLTKA